MASLNENITSNSLTDGQGQIQNVELSPFTQNGEKTDESDIEFKKIREEHRHEFSMIKYGSFGKIFGSEENSSKNLTFTILSLILIIWFILSIISIWTPCLINSATKMFEIIIPIITLAFGYFFGKK